MNAPFVKKQSLQCLTIFTLCVASASAFAQSAEFRRGYDQGYRDGIEAQERDGKRAPERIMILEARYGTRDDTCDARETVRRMVGWRRHADIPVNNDLCGDPATGRHKRLVVEYRCGDSPKQRIETPEPGMMSLFCGQ